MLVTQVHPEALEEQEGLEDPEGLEGREDERILQKELTKILYM